MNQNGEKKPLDEALRRFIDDLRGARFFGVVELHFQDGHLLRVKKQEVFQPADLMQLTSK